MVDDRGLPMKGMSGKVVLAAVDKAVESRWDEALELARRTPGRTIDEKVDAIIARHVKELAAVGAAAGGTAAVPGVGTITALSASAAELGWFGLRATDMILTIAAAHGHTAADVEQRRAWVLAILAFGEGAAVGFSEVAGSIGAGVGVQAARSAPNSWFHKVNNSLSRKLLIRWGSRRGAAMLGKLLPFGVGAAFGAGANFMAAKAIARHARKFFKQLPVELHAPPSRLSHLPPPPDLAKDVSGQAQPTR